MLLQFLWALLKRTAVAYRSIRGNLRFNWKIFNKWLTMASVKKKKIYKEDVKASEQMRNWLTTPKASKWTPPVSFKTFSNLVENLPDIAFQIQCTEIGTSKKTLDECAQWYFEAFYTDPSIRTKYEIKLKACPLAIKEKLLKLPGVSSREEVVATATDCIDDNAQTEDGVEVKVSKYGKFLFPVTYATFENYIDKQKMIAHLVSKETRDKTQRNILLEDKSICKKLLRKYYNSFYLFPNRRKLDKFNFQAAPVALQERLLKVGVPLDKLAVESMTKHAKPAHSTTEPHQDTNTSEGLSSIVSFDVFERHIKNLYHIVWQLKLGDSNFACKGFEDCAYAYYLAFYLTPEIRNKYPYELIPCTLVMRHRLLATPNEADLKMLEMQNRQFFNSQELKSDMNVAETSQHAEPNQMQEFINSQEQQFEMDFDNNSEHAEPNQIQEFINSQEQQLEMDFDNNSRHAAPNETALGIPEAAEEIEVTTTQTTESDKHFITKAVVSKAEMLQDTLPVTFQMFKRYITNLNEIAQQMLFSEEYKGKSEEECALEFYKMFYKMPQIRDKFKYVLRPCPALMRHKLLTIPQDSDITLDADCNKFSVELLAEHKLVTVKGTTYKYIIPFETFVHYINYAELKTQLANAYEKKKSKDSENLNEEQLIKRFYYSFYIDEKVRKQFDFNFDAAPIALLDKLMAFAKPLTHNRMRNNERTISTELCEVQAQQEPTAHLENASIPKITSNDCELDVIEDLGKAGRFKFPVSLTSFKQCINYDELIRPLLMRITQDEEHLLAMLSIAIHPQCTRMFKRYYHSFYVRPDTRSLYEYRFENVSTELLEKLLEYAQPLDVNAHKTMDEATMDRTPAIKDQQQAHAIKDRPLAMKEQQLTKSSPILPVTFKFFKKYIVNLDEIVQQMLISEEYQGKSEEDCALEYYKSFYVDPRIRAKFTYIVKPCPATLRDKLLRLPTDKQSMKSKLMETEPASMTVEPKNDTIVVLSERILISMQGVTYEYPVSLQTFKRFINYDTVKLELAKEFSKDREIIDENIHEKLIRRYYHSFYLDESARKICNYNFNAAPLECQDKLLQFAVPVAKDALPLPLSIVNISNDRYQKLPDNSLATPVNNPVSNEEQILRSQRKFKYPISYNIFSNVMIVDEVVKQMQLEDQFADLNANECKQAFYEAFYRTPEIRTKYNWTLKPCPAVLKAKILQIPQVKSDLSHCISPVVNSENFPSIIALHEKRKILLQQMEKSNVVNYLPHNIQSYVALRTQSERKRALLESHLIKLRENSNKETTRPITETSSTKTNTDSHTDLSTERSRTDHSASKDLASAATIKCTAAVRHAADSTTSTITSHSGPDSVGKSASVVSTKPNEEVTTKKEQTPQFTEISSNLRGTHTSSSAGNTVTLTVASSTTNPGSTAFDQFNMPVTVPATVAATNFFSSTSKEHNLKYLLLTSHGLKKTAWHILSQLNYEEFKIYTFIYNNKTFYEDDSLLHRCYHHVVFKGNWPIDLYVRMEKLCELFCSKGFQLIEFNLEYLSPKIFHWTELILFTNIGQIVRLDYKKRTGNDIENEQLYTVIEQFYVLCWDHDRWISQAPQISPEVNTWLLGEHRVVLPVLTERNGVPFCILENTEAIAESHQVVSDLNDCAVKMSNSFCPATQLDVPLGALNFVDMDFVCPASQITETQNDPLLQFNTSNTLEQAHIKQEPIQFLDRLRFSLNSNFDDDFICESLSAEEQVIDLDDDGTERLRAELACFGMSQETQEDTYQCLLGKLQQLSHEPQPADNPLTLQEIPVLEDNHREVHPSQQIVGTSPIVVVSKNQAPATKHLKKKPRLMAENVPQLRHEFRALPLAAMVRIESNLNPAYLAEDNLSDADQQAHLPNAITASQAFATDNTLMASSQLQHLLDAPFVSQRKVNEEVEMLSVNNKSEVASSRANIFHSLERYMYFRSLTTAQISKYHINKLSIGSPYQQALIYVNGQLCNVHGPLLETLFSHCSSKLLINLRYLLWTVGEFNYNSRRCFRLDSTEDLRIRVLNTFMRLAPPFSYFRLQFENETREWAVCSTIDDGDCEILQRKPSCDIKSTIRPEILERMKKFKSLYSNRHRKASII